ncbi:hypothetical protein, partial [Halomonas garicola]
LHVLSLPPAFNLSHDQTLRFTIIVILAFRCPRALEKADQTWLKVPNVLKKSRNRDFQILTSRLP